MIKSATIYKGDKDLFTNKLYIKKGEKSRTFQFTDGINIITGRNGSGKSVLLKILKTLCGITDKNSTHATMIDPLHIKKDFLGSRKDENNYYTYPEYFKNKLKNWGYPNANVKWDGSITHYLTPEFFNPKNLWEIWDNPIDRGGQKLFNTAEVLNSFMDDYSAGEGGIKILEKLYHLTQSYPEPMDRNSVNDVWIDADVRFHKWIDSLPKNEKPTLLIDELDARLDLDNQKAYWGFIGKLAEIWQVIVVSHSYFAFQLNDVNHIKLDEKYFNKVREL
jgi:energy-coupling factor transporter ATP-binding protein EcfA2